MKDPGLSVHRAKVLQSVARRPPVLRAAGGELSPRAAPWSALYAGQLAQRRHQAWQ
eukprot:CAMPEP_0171285206 /NCGR_PEP_ID=MMETSP0790-20130122/68334_1 /TAXON_ID=2925 /ORGANISM="Alexandrium catenella, Strain OF101" /LENGTH=55 /DNA_ID=CAMNT_0011754525 /DNA_START=10 /DNA_END=174 /DNA_ORIENTATION=+